MTGHTRTPRIAILAPDARSALTLERRLSHLQPTAVGRYESWEVELEDEDERLDEVLLAVSHWLRDEGIETTSVLAGESTFEVAAPDAPPRDP